MPQHFIDVLRDEVKVVNRRRELVAAGRLAKNRGHVGRHPKPHETSGYMGGQTGRGRFWGDLMSAWDPDKLEKRGNMFTEVADKVGKLAEAVADIAGLLDKALGSGQLAKSPSMSKASDMTAECLARALPRSTGTCACWRNGSVLFCCCGRPEVSPQAPYLWVSEKGQRNGQAGTLGLWEASPRSRFHSSGVRTTHPGRPASANAFSRSNASQRLMAFSIEARSLEHRSSFSMRRKLSG